MVRSWSALAKSYGGLLQEPFVRNWPALSSMEKLVQAIEISPYASGLFAWKSMHFLCVAQTEVTYPYNGPLLRITPLNENWIEFRYVDTCLKTKQYQRTVDGAAAFARLESFIEQLRWFVHYEVAPIAERQGLQ